MRLTDISAVPFPVCRVGIRLRFFPGLAVVCLLVSAVCGETSSEMAYADLLFKKKEYIKAAGQYRIFVDRYPSSKQIQTGWFQLGESYRAGGRLEEARATFQNMVDKYRKGPRVGAASFRLGILNFKAHDFNNAVMDFERASREVESPRVKYQAKYYNARSLQMIRKTDLALALYEQLMRTNPGPETNHFREKSILESARIYSDRGDSEKAREYYQKLIESATNASVREEAVARCGLAEVASGNIEEGAKILEGAKRFRKDSQWKALAEVGALFIAYEKRDYARVVSIYSSGTIINSAGEYRPRVLLMVADAFRARGDLKAADRLYTLVESCYPAAEAGIEAGFRRLTMLYKGNSGVLPAAVEKYANAVGSREPENPCIDKAYLMLAEWHFFQAEKGVARKNSKFAGDQFRFAGAAYEKVREDKIDESLVPTLLHHQSWAYLESGEIAGGARTVTTLLERFPESSLVPEALARRGEAFLAREDFTSALSDFQLIISNYPESPALELAMERRGRIYAHKRMLSETVSCYEALLEHFPGTGGKAEAHYWIGEGYFEQKDFKKALPHLESARKTDPELYANRALIRMILCHHSLNQIPEMTEAARIYIQSGRDAGVLNAKQKRDKPLEIPPHVLAGLGKKLAGKKQYGDAEFFLNRVITLDDPSKTGAEVWKDWATTKLKLKDYHAAIKGFDHMLVRTRNRGQRGYAYVNRGHAQFALGQYERARISARECIRVVKQGRINAEARLLIGDIARENGDIELAAREYCLVSRIFNDPKITPLALNKGIQMNQKLGENDKVAELEQEMRDWTAVQKKKR